MDTPRPLNVIEDSALRRLFELGDHSLVPMGRPGIERRDGVVVETWAFSTAAGEAVRGLVTRPEAVAGPMPAVLYIHAHGNRYDIGADELIAGRPALQGPLGPVLAREGILLFAIDLPAFGGRQSPGESARAKAALWHGRSLAGQMLGELAAALDWLAAREDVDAARIGAFGISMGATLGYWLAAVDSRLAAVAHLCCFADFDVLIDRGAHDLHGIYLTIPGLLETASNGALAGRIAPRPQLICIGDRDPLTPPEAVDPALAQVRAAYAAAGAEAGLRMVRDPDAGHEETPAMRRALLEFLGQALRA